MKNTIDETVKYAKDLNCKYSINEIENLTVYNPLLKVFQKSEDWSSNKKTDCLFIGGFIATIDSKAHYYFGDSIDYGYSLNEPSKLIFITPSCKVIGFEKIGSFNLEKEFKRPCTMLDLGMQIDNFIYHVKDEMQKLVFSIHQKQVKQIKKTVFRFF